MIGPNIEVELKRVHVKFRSYNSENKLTEKPDLHVIGFRILDFLEEKRLLAYLSAWIL